VYEEVDDSDRCIFQVNGVQSSLGETLTFEEVRLSCCIQSGAENEFCLQPVMCEGQIESWLNVLVNTMKETLQYQLALALGSEQKKKRRELHSAGARKVPMPERSGSARSAAGKSLIIK
jgi:hypothetical protein